MSTEVFIRGFFAFLFGLIFAYSTFHRQQQEKYASVDTDTHRRYLPYGGTWILPVYLATINICSVIKAGPDITMRLFPSLYFGVFLHISIYYLLLLIALPYLRKHISARGCAELWMLPNFLYIVHSGFMALPRPLLILQIPSFIVCIAIFIWLTGLCMILLWKVIEHFCFRHKILRNAYAITDPGILVIWHREQSAAGYQKNPSCLVYSPNIRTPLSIGFFSWSVRIVLPERTYTSEELALIFRHEIIHISRADCQAKFFLIFCTAMCWFNPLMWTAGRHCSDDLELSCDETVLLNTGSETRRQYAELLLRTAGDDRGFTSCLSNSVRAMHYRLKNVLSTGKKKSGCILIGLTFFFLIMSFGYVSVSFDEGLGREYIFDNKPLSEYSVKKISRLDTDGLHYYDCNDTDALKEFLEELPFGRLTGNYTFPEYTDNISITFHGPEGIFVVDLQDDCLKITFSHRKNVACEMYYCPDNINWDLLYSMITPQA